jgi:tRNA(Ile)-lysidine synthase
MDWIQNKRSFLCRFPPNARYLVGVSGGRDSVALLDWLVECGYRKLVVCHLNHRLRGRSSEADARFVANLSDKYDLDLEIDSADVRALAAKQKLSIEAAARAARYEFFAAVAKRRRCRTIFLAHHADDLVETFLINLFRGAGTTGLAAMREISKRRMRDIDLTLVRPFLGAWRVEIDRYIREHRLRFREDASNKNLLPMRNRLRHRVVPYLEKAFGRNIRSSIWRAAAIAAEEQAWIEQQVAKAGNHDLSVATLRELPIALQRRQILKWLRSESVPNVGFDAVESVRSLLDHSTGVAKINLPQNRHVRRRAGKIFVE